MRRLRLGPLDDVRGTPGRLHLGRSRRAGFERAKAFIEEILADTCGRLSALLCPMQIDTCTPALLRASAEYAEANALGLTIHASQTVLETQHIIARHGKTPVQWAAEIGLLGPRCILGHAIFTDHHSWLHWWSRNDLERLATTGTHVAHCPTPFARYGAALESFGRYRRAGVGLALGTDTTPHNLLEEMRLALRLGRVVDGDVDSTDTAAVFHAATVGGADALGRDDLGRLAAGAQADLLLVDGRHPAMEPLRDPLRSLIHSAADRAIHDVYVAGRQVVAAGEVITLDRRSTLDRLRAGQQRMEAAVPIHDYAQRRSETIAPLSLPLE